MIDISNAAGYATLALYVTWKDVIPWLTRRNGKNGNGGKPPACQADAVVTILNTQTRILAGLEAGQEKMHEAQIRLLTMAQMKWGGGGGC